MKYINAALMGGFFSLVVGAPAITNDNIFGGPMSKYDITDIIWEVPINPERNITVVGTIEDVIHHLQQVAPEIAEAKFPSVPRSESTSVLLSSAGASINTPAPNKVTCGISDHTASFAQIMVGVRYLRLLRNGPGMGPNRCGRVSCSYDSAILWCNDSPEHLVLDSWGMIADGAEQLTRCTIGFGISGQAYYDKWSVKVQGAKC